MIIAITLTSDGHSVNWELSFSEFRRFICIFSRTSCILYSSRRQTWLLSFKNGLFILNPDFQKKISLFRKLFLSMNAPMFWNSGLIPTFLPLNKKGYFWHWNSLLRINLYRVYPIQRNDCLLSLERRIVLEWTTWIDLRFSI